MRRKNSRLQLQALQTSRKAIARNQHVKEATYSPSQFPKISAFANISFFLALANSLLQTQAQPISWDSPKIVYLESQDFYAEILNDFLDACHGRDRQSMESYIDKIPTDVFKFVSDMDREPLKAYLRELGDLSSFENILLMRYKEAASVLYHEYKNFVSKTYTDIPYFIDAFQYGRKHLMRFLLNHFDFHEEKDSGLILHHLMRAMIEEGVDESYIEKLMEELIAKDINVNQQDPMQITPLHLAVTYKKDRIVRLLLNANADIHIPSYGLRITDLNRYPTTPLDLAELYNNSDVLNLGKTHQEARDSAWRAGVGGAILLGLMGVAFIAHKTYQNKKDKKAAQAKRDRSISGFLNKCTEDFCQDSWQITGLNQVTLKLTASIVQYDAEFLKEVEPLASSLTSISFPKETIIKIIYSLLKKLFSENNLIIAKDTLIVKLSAETTFSARENINEITQFRRRCKQELADSLEELKVIKARNNAADALKQKYKSILDSFSTMEKNILENKSEWMNIDSDSLEKRMRSCKRVENILQGQENSALKRKLTTIVANMNSASNLQSYFTDIDTKLEETKKRLDDLSTAMKETEEEKIDTEEIEKELTSIQDEINNKIKPLYDEIKQKTGHICYEENWRKLLEFLEAQTPAEAAAHPLQPEVPAIAQKEHNDQQALKDKPVFFKPKKRPANVPGKTETPFVHETPPAQPAKKPGKVEIIVNQKLPQDYHPIPKPEKPKGLKLFKQPQQPSKLPAETLRRLATVHVYSLDAYLNLLPFFNLQDEIEQKILHFATLYHLVRVLQALWLEGMAEKEQNNTKKFSHVKAMRHMVVHLFDQIEINSLITASMNIKEQFFNYLKNIGKKGANDQLTKEEYFALSQQMKSLELYQELLPFWGQEDDNFSLINMLKQLKEACNTIEQILKVIDSREMLERKGADRLAAVKMLYFTIGEYGALLRDAEESELRNTFEYLNQKQFLNACIDIRNIICHVFKENGENVGTGKLLGLSKGLGKQALLTDFKGLVEERLDWLNRNVLRHT